MKALIAIVGLVLLGQTASANQNVFTYRMFLAGQSKEGNFCPQLVRATAVNEVGSLRGKAVHLVDIDGAGDVFVYQNTTRTCREDVVCVSENHFRQNGSGVTVSLKLENNGVYPTTDLPGYTQLKLSWTAPDTGTLKSCMYLFF